MAARLREPALLLPEAWEAAGERRARSSRELPGAVLCPALQPTQTVLKTVVLDADCECGRSPGFSRFDVPKRRRTLPHRIVCAPCEFAKKFLSSNPPRCPGRARSGQSSHT